MLEQATAGVRKLDENPKDVSAIADPLAPNSTQLSNSGRVAYFDAQFDRTGFELPRGDIVNLEDQLKATGQAAGLEVAFTGEAESPPPEDFLSIVLGLTAGFIILLVLFRALVPTVIPLLFAIAAVMTAFLLLYLLARFTNFNTIVTLLVPMIGLGVGIDYTLFIVTRFRQMLHDGLSPKDAAAAAGATAGRAVIFAGVTVAISVTGLALIGIDFITKLGIGSALGVLTAVLLANSLLPAVLALLGHKIDRGRLGMKPSDESREGRLRTPVARWGRFVTRNAKIVLPAVLVVLLRAGVARAEGAAGPGRCRHGPEGPDHPQGLRPAVRSRRLRPRIHLADPGGGRPAVATTRRPSRSSRRMKQVPGIAQVDKPIYNAKTPDQAPWRS